MDSQEILVAIIGSGAFSTLVSLIVNQVNKHLDNKSGANTGLRLVLKDRVQYLCLQYLKQGWIYADDLEELLTMHSCYHSTLRGNGYLDSLIDRVKKVEIRYR